jgi:hypothetical protein
MMWYTGSSRTLNLGGWWYNYTTWQHIREPLRTSGLKERVTGAVGKISSLELSHGEDIGGQSQAQPLEKKK